MAICAVIDNPGQTREQADEVMKALRATGPLPPTGATYVLGGEFEGGWRVVSIWDSEESMERFFSTRLPAAFREVGLAPERLTRSTFAVYKQGAAEHAGSAQSS
jgi:hypothetical protein